MNLNQLQDEIAVPQVARLMRLTSIKLVLINMFEMITLFASQVRNVITLCKTTSLEEAVNNLEKFTIELNELCCYR